MPAYLIAFVEVTNPEKYQDYTKLTPAAIEKYGGKFIARGGEVLTLEGLTETRRTIIVEFPSMKQAQTFYNSPEYQTAKEKRQGAAEGQFMIVNGI